MFRLLFFLLTVTRLSAQSFQAPALLGMGSTAAAYQGIHSPLANPAGMARLQNYSISTAYQQHYSLSDLYSYGAYGVLPIFKTGAVGIQIYQYNSSNVLQQTIWEASYAYPFANNWSAAFGFQQRRVAWEDISSMATNSISAGLQYQRNNLVIGGYFQELNLSNSDNAFLPRQPLEVLVGISYLFSEQLYFATDIFWERDQTPQLHTGLTYQLHRCFRVRGGISSQPVQYYVGLGVANRNIHLDLAASIHRELGASPQLGLSYVF